MDNRIRRNLPRSLLFFLRSAVVLLAVVLPISLAAGDRPAKELAQESLSRLKAGNTRFARGMLQAKDFARERQELVQGQHPYAIVLACSDSRVPPELLFDESLGKLFIVRVGDDFAGLANMAA